MIRITKILFFVAIFAGAITFAELFLLPQNTSPENAQPRNSISSEQANPSEDTKINTQKSEKPEDQIATDEKNTSENPADPDHINPLPSKYLLDIPFYSQAPLSVWDSFHEEMCEEASALNAGLYLEDKKLSLENYEVELHAIQKIEKDNIGDWKSTTIEQTKKFVDMYFGGKIKTKILENPTIEDIETEIAAGLPAGASSKAGHPVLIPLAGRDIGNPNFTPPGPVYHMLVIKGFDANNFITNDVGTRKGNSYAYPKNVIMANMHDWNAKDIHLGAKRVLVLYIND